MSSKFRTKRSRWENVLTLAFGQREDRPSSLDHGIVTRDGSRGLAGPLGPIGIRRLVVRSGALTLKLNIVALLRSRRPGIPQPQSQMTVTTRRQLWNSHGVPSLVVRATNPYIQLLRSGLECTESIIWHGYPVVPDDWSRAGTFVVRDGERRQADGWTLPVTVVLRRPNSNSREAVVGAGGQKSVAAGQAMGRSGKLVVGTMYLQWKLHAGKGDTPPAHIKIVLESPASEFDSIAARAAICDDAEITVLSSQWFPERQPKETQEQRMLRTGLVHGEHPDGKDMIWDASMSAETEIESFSLQLSRNAGDKPLRQEIDAASAQAQARGERLRESIEGVRKVNVRISWILLTLGALGVLAWLAA